MYQKIENIEDEILPMKKEYIKHELSKFGTIEEYNDNIYKDSTGYKVRMKGNNVYVTLINNGKKVRIMIIKQNDKFSKIIENMFFEGMPRNGLEVYSIIIPFNKLRNFFEDLEKIAKN